MHSAQVARLRSKVSMSALKWKKKEEERKCTCWCSHPLSFHGRDYPLFGKFFLFCNNADASVQSLSCVQLSVTPWTAARQASLSIINSWSLLKLMSPELEILCCPLLLLSISPSIRVFSNESVLRIRWPKYWGFSFSISSSNEYSGLIYLRMDWLDILAVQGTLKSLSSTPQFKSINSSALSFLYSPTLISIHDYWKNHSFD